MTNTWLSGMSPAALISGAFGSTPPDSDVDGWTAVTEGWTDGLVGAAVGEVPDAAGFDPPLVHDPATNANTTVAVAKRGMRFMEVLFRLLGSTTPTVGKVGSAPAARKVMAR